MKKVAWSEAVCASTVSFFPLNFPVLEGRTLSVVIVNGP